MSITQKSHFLKSLDIASISNKMEMLHPSTHEFWDNEEIRTKFLDYLAVWYKNPAAYLKQGFYCQDSTTTAENFVDDEENIEVGFVDGLFEMFKIERGN